MENRLESVDRKLDIVAGKVTDHDKKLANQEIRLSQVEKVASASSLLAALDKT